MFETNSDMESKAAIAAQQHATELRNTVEDAIDVAQHYASEAAEYVGTFFTTLFAKK